MPHQGPDVPHRTSRSRALEVGTDPRGFDDVSEAFYDPQAGHPTNTGLPGGHYVEQAPQVGGPGGPVENIKPFEVKK